MKIEKLLNEEISSELSELEKIDMGTDEHKTAVDKLTKLIDRAIELEKMNIESEDKYESRQFDEDYKIKQMNHDKKDKTVKNCISIIGIIIPTIVTIWGTLISLKFEEEGSVTTIMGRGFVNKLLPKSKN